MYSVYNKQSHRRHSGHGGHISYRKPSPQRELSTYTKQPTEMVKRMHDRARNYRDPAPYSMLDQLPKDYYALPENYDEFSKNPKP